mgnify:CR=1 FL=1
MLEAGGWTVEYKKESTLRAEGLWEDFLLFKRNKEAIAQRIGNDKEVKAAAKKARKNDLAKAK